MKTVRQNLLAIPILVWFGLLVGIPLIYVVVLSFMSRDSLGNIVFQLPLRIISGSLTRFTSRCFSTRFAGSADRHYYLVIGYPVAYITAKLSGNSGQPQLV